MIGFFGFFGLKFSNCSPLKLIFSEGPYFLYVLFVIMGLWNCACTWQPCQRHWACHDQASLQKNEQVTTWLLSFCLEEFQQIYSEIFFQFRFSLFPPACLGSCSVFALGVLWFFCFVLHKMIGFFVFFGLKFSNYSPLKLVFSEGPSFFVRSLCNRGALKLSLHVAALSASLAMSWPAEIT